MGDFARSSPSQHTLLDGDGPFGKGRSRARSRASCSQNPAFPPPPIKEKLDKQKQTKTPEERNHHGRGTLREFCSCLSLESRGLARFNLRAVRQGMRHGMLLLNIQLGASLGNPESLSSFPSLSTANIPTGLSPTFQAFSSKPT